MKKHDFFPTEETEIKENAIKQTLNLTNNTKVRPVTSREN